MEVSVSDYKRLNDDALVEIEQVLRRRGTSAGRRGDSLRCELSFGGAPYGVAYFVSAPFLFALDQQPVAEQGLDAYELESQRSKRRDFENDFRQFQEELFSDDVGAQPRKDLYLFVVGTATFLQHELDSRRRGLVEQNASYARKVIVTLEQTVDLLTNPFALNRAVPEAGGRPTFDTVAELYDLAEDAPLVTHSFCHRDVNVTPDPVLLTSRAYADIRKRVDSTVLRVMGSDYRVFWFSDSINIGRAAETRGVPLGFASSGEQKVFSFALWLAALADTATPATRLGVYGVLNGLGSLWMVGALDALRDFVVATGASIRLQAPQSDKRSFAERKFQPVANIVNSRARGLTH